MEQYHIDHSKLLEFKATYDAATKGEWKIWDGPLYCGGGADLCIGAGERWLANMDHRYHVNHSEAVEHQSADNCKDPGCDICSFSSDVTKEQRANSVFIIKAKNEIIPWLMEQLEVLEDHYGEALERIKDLEERLFKDD